MNEPSPLPPDFADAERAAVIDALRRYAEKMREGYRLTAIGLFRREEDAARNVIFALQDTMFDASRVRTPLDGLLNPATKSREFLLMRPETGVNPDAHFEPCQIRGCEACAEAGRNGQLFVAGEMVCEHGRHITA